MSNVALHLGDCRDVLPTIADASVGAIVTDPPSSIGFGGESWDSNKGGRAEWVAWLAGIMSECSRCLEPGGYALVWAIPRRSHWTATAIEDAGFQVRDCVTHIQAQGRPINRSCLKPATEHWWLAKKPGATQSLNIDSCVIEYESAADYDATMKGVNRMAVSPERSKPGANHHAVWRRPWMERKSTVNVASVRPGGRYPANLALSCCGRMPHEPACPVGDLGEASRYFYCPKPRPAERGPGNMHPTCKPTDLMRWLCRLITPPSGMVLDPFAGSGTTGVACLAEGFNFIGIESDPDYHAIAERRIAAATAEQPLFTEPAARP